ncbi:PDDEXK nuclease domain-containing protein [Pirellulaceae bacterium SH449]
MTNAKDIAQTTTHLSSDFSELVQSINTIDKHLSEQAARAVNVSLTLRNWLIGFRIQEYEQHGNDRAAYGERLLELLAQELKAANVSRSDVRELRRYRLFYQLYPQIRDALSPEFSNLLSQAIRDSANPEFRKSLDINDLGSKSSMRKTESPISGKELVSSLSFTHFRELLRCDEADKRAFYEAECIRGSWSVNDLKRQINSLLYERSKLSLDKQKLREQSAVTADTVSPRLVIRDPYVFEFLRLKPMEVMSESHLEDQLLDKLQEFLLELGQGFCFEARQRRILIGDKYYFVDLVFYHRILKCHVLVDLKLEEFTHENIGQLNTYVSWFDKNVREQGDNPPIGILLCTAKDHALVQYALAAMDNSLFVSQYQLQLPTEEILKQQIEAERRRLEAEQESSHEMESQSQ